MKNKTIHVLKFGVKLVFEFQIFEIIHLSVGESGLYLLSRQKKNSCLCQCSEKWLEMQLLTRICLICPINNLFMRELGLIPRGFRHIYIRPLVRN